MKPLDGQHQVASTLSQTFQQHIIKFYSTAELLVLIQSVVVMDSVKGLNGRSAQMPPLLNGEVLEKLAAQRLRAALHSHPLLKFVMWSVAAHLAAYGTVPTCYIHSLGYQTHPEAMQFCTAPHVGRNANVHRFLSMACGNAYGSLNLRAAAEVVTLNLSVTSKILTSRLVLVQGTTRPPCLEILASVAVCGPKSCQPPLLGYS